ncbi:glycosyltransferase [Streptomyces sp. NPDC096176]|uniref:glycosyltransferase n=1 Tax=Streptomyces sp. NPDC096176 TaxID=3366079 RepID=UPI0037FA075B
MDRLRENGIQVEVCAVRPSKYLPPPGWLPDVRVCRLAYLVAGMLAIVAQRLWHILTVVPRVDVVLLQKDLLFRTRVKLLERLLFLVARRRRVRVIFDLDDAVYLGTSQRQLAHMGRKIAFIARSSCVVLAGSWAIAENLAPHARQLHIYPTCIEPGEAPRRLYHQPGSRLRLVWAGTPTNALHLAQVNPALRELRDVIDLEVELVTRLRELPNNVLDGAQVRLTEWSEDAERLALARADAALAPLDDSAWARAKCGGKILGYFAAALPVIASPVGTQAVMVRHGNTGLQATTPEEWRDCLLALHRDDALRARLGQAGRRYVEDVLSAERRFNEFRDHLMGRVRRVEPHT